MNSATFFNISAGAYLAAMITYVIYLVARNRTTGIVATALTLFGLVSQTAALIIRWVNSYDFWISSSPGSGYFEALLRAAPLRNLYESLIFFVWALIVIHLITEFKYKNR